jgi:phosphatidylinositol alpha-1,6-mannosyltransferase
MGGARDFCVSEMKPRILIVTPDFPPAGGGIGTHCFEMAKHWSSVADVLVVSVTEDPTHREVDAPFRLVEISRPRSRFLRVAKLARELRSLIRERHPDLVYSAYWRNAGVALRLAMAGLGVKPIYAQAIHGSEVAYLLTKPAPRLHRSLFLWTIRRAKSLVALGSYQAELLARIGVDGERVLTEPEGVDVARFAGVDNGALAAIRDGHRLAGRFVLLSVGRLVEHKGHDVVIRALPRAARSLPNLVYLIVGSGPDETRLRSLAREVGVEDSVVFCGRVSEAELVAYYNSCDAFIMMSRELPDDVEGFGIVFMEAAACGKPTIGGLSGGVRDAVVDGETGFLVEPTDVEAVADAIVRLGVDVPLAGRLGEAGRSRVHRSYQYRDIARDILNGIAPGIG